MTKFFDKCYFINKFVDCCEGENEEKEPILLKRKRTLATKH